MDGNLKILLDLIEAHPDLPVVPMVSSEVVDDGDGWYLGSFGLAGIDDYIIDRYGNVIFRQEDDVYDALERALSVEALDALPDSEPAYMEAYESLPWRKAIIVWIDES